jgi:hypothetical protein
MTKEGGQGRVERRQKRNGWKEYKEEEGWRKKMMKERGGIGEEGTRIIEGQNPAMGLNS